MTGVFHAPGFASSATMSITLESALACHHVANDAEFFLVIRTEPGHAELEGAG
jgi:hypothetical protein